MSTDWPLPWEVSATEEFDSEELARIAASTAEDLIAALSQSDPLVVLRALYELLAHGENEKLTKVAQHEDVKPRWGSVFLPPFSRDGIYLMSLSIFFLPEPETTEE